MASSASESAGKPVSAARVCYALRCAKGRRVVGASRRAGRDMVFAVIALGNLPVFCGGSDAPAHPPSLPIPRALIDVGRRRSPLGIRVEYSSALASAMPPRRLVGGRAKWGMGAHLPRFYYEVEPQKSNIAAPVPPTPP